ncbi:MAG: type III-B CRISPR-associated protein Cas10/Cmr2, partial [Gammaproteobacteria bacterium]|nr:type III-B CRISPR-associated protein Cas10/Cmr2 [Gammaproteobacteria bacterium]
MTETQNPWDVLLRSWLHDPVDKAADIRGHFSRAVRYASIVLGYEVTEQELKGGFADQRASAYERLPIPDARGNYEELGVQPGAQGELTIIHPLSARASEIRVPLREREVRALLAEMFSPEMDARRRFLKLWRCVPGRMAEFEPGYARQPAETRNPDHTIWQHLDTTSAMAWAMEGGAGAAALLSFKLGPVQPFIEAARSMRDLLTGSYLLSTLAFAAIKPILKSCGPTALVYPALRGLPVMDEWLIKEVGLDWAKPTPESLLRPALPHRFLAL